MINKIWKDLQTGNLVYYKNARLNIFNGYLYCNFYGQTAKTATRTNLRKTLKEIDDLINYTNNEFIPNYRGI